MNIYKIYIISTIFLFLSSSTSAQNEESISKNDKKEIKGFINKAVEEFSNTRYDKALDYSKKALMKSFEVNDDSHIAQSYNTIGVIYDECNESKRAIEFYEKALRFARRINNDTLNNWIYNNLGSAYYFNDIDVDRGIENYKKALFFAKKIKDESQILHINLNLASALLAVNENYKADVILKSIKESVLKNNSDEVHLSYNLLLGIQSTHNDHKKDAEEYYAKAQVLAEKNNLQTNLLNIYENLSSHYKYYNDTKNQELYQEKYDSLYATLYTEDKMYSLEKQALDIELDE